MKNIFLLFFISFVFLTVGCERKSFYKELLQKDIYDKRNPDGNRAFCYFLGDVKFPYVLSPISNEDSLTVKENKEELLKRLPIFAQLGLLKRDRFDKEDNNRDIYVYSLSDEGKKYQYEYIRNKSVESSFCFGRIIVNDVNDVNEVKAYDMSKSSYMDVRIDFNFKIENLPQWATSVELNKAYGEGSSWDGGRKFYHGIHSLKKKDGKYFDSIGMGYGRIGYFLPPTE